jgi:putative hydrolase of the HAD superfamily
MQAIRAVIFDWGWTLTPFHSLDLMDLWLVLARALAPERAEDLAAALLAAEAEFWQRSTSRAGADSATLDDILDLAAPRTGLELRGDQLPPALDAYLEAWTPHTIAQPEVAPMLIALRDRGLRTGLLSNTHWPRSWHERILERDGIAHLLEARVCTSELQHTKPHSEGFAAVLSRLDVKPHEAVMVGDRPVDDIGGAKSLGMRAVLLPNDQVPTGSAVPDATIRSLAELVPLIDTWLGFSM